ncbi:methyltransferase [Candidatus Poribacteria bacterium]|nr:MAG: methyltransferase [Candidatus Poribacteria bacterium]
MNVNVDISFKTQIRGYDLTFNSTWGLFSPKSIDAGTRLLIDCIDIHTDDICLDLGCGYGAVGIAMAKCAEPSEVYMVDKDFVAVEYARMNIENNKLKNCHVLLSNGFSHLPDIQFDIIASNLPANIGNELMKIFFNDAKRFLKKNGRLYVVTIAGLKDFIKRNFIETFGNHKKIKQRNTHTVSMAILS